MATPKQLVHAVATALHVPEATVTVHDRNLSVAGLRSMGGRGRAAAQVTARDAANLLIATAASRNVKDSVESVRVYGNLVSTEKWNWRIFPDFASSKVKLSLADALSSLVEFAATGILTKEKLKGHELFVRFFGVEPEAEIEVMRAKQTFKQIDANHNRYAIPGPGGLNYSMYFTDRALVEVAKVFSSA
ncbi:hypothetical protein V1290_004408 [Bradyrhizobium sp. AZCC 1578]|uniref:hypothetical protein n=1 Tax=Bradyrhizobium sp. AZCC 1578 TaxID=3117027 RepID=UPI002FF2522D